MTVQEVCAYFDLSQIVDAQIEIDRDYYSAMGESSIYTDGEIKSHITSEGYIHITSVQNASYIIFADREYHTCLCVYKYIPDITCKYIIENLHRLQYKINTTMVDNNISNDDINIDSHIDDDVIDINSFTCTECDSKDKMIFRRSGSNCDILEAKCKTCKTEYTFTPSKYYKMASKRVIYFKSEKSSRDVNIEPHIEYTTIADTNIVADLDWHDK